MTRDISSIVDGELDAIAPPSPLSGPALAATGRRGLRRRRFAGLLGGVAVIAAASVLAVTALGGTPPESPASDVQPSFPLPELDPSKTYDWEYASDEATPETERLTAALWERLSALDGVEVLALDRGTGHVAAPETVEDLADFPPITRADNKLLEDGPEGRIETGHVQPLYEMYGVGRVVLSRPGAAKMQLLVEMYPKGGYLAEAPDGVGADQESMPVPYLQPDCEGLGGEVYAIAHDCSEPRTEGRDSIFELQYVVGDATPTADMHGLRVVRYFANGNALVITLAGLVPSGEQAEPVLTGEALAELARSLPAVPVI